MSKTKKTGEKKTKGLESLGEHMNKDVLPHAGLPKLGPSNLKTVEDIKQFSGAVADLVKQVSEYGRRIGETLKLEGEDLEFALEGIFADEDQVTSFINEVSSTAARRQLARAYMFSLVENIPHTWDGLEHLANQGLAVGILSEVSKDVGGGLDLPVTVERGFQWQYLRVPHGEEKVYSAIKKITDELEAAHQAAEEVALNELRSGASSDLLATLETGGEVVFFLHKKQGFEDGNVRVKVEDGWIRPVAAVGECQETVAAAVEYDIEIPVSSLQGNRVELKEHIPQDEFRALLAFHRLCRRGYVSALRGQKIRASRAAMQERATVSINDFVLRGVIGMAYLFLKILKTQGGTFKGVWGLVERNQAGDIRVVDCPDWLDGLFSKCREFAPANRLEDPLGPILKTLTAVLSKSEARRENESSDGEAEGLEDTGTLPVKEGDDGRVEFTPRTDVKAEAEAALAATLKPSNQ